MIYFIGCIVCHIMAIILGGLFGGAMAGHEVAGMWMFGIGMVGFEGAAMVLMFGFIFSGSPKGE